MVFAMIKKHSGQCRFGSQRKKQRNPNGGGDAYLKAERCCREEWLALCQAGIGLGEAAAGKTNFKRKVGENEG